MLIVDILRLSTRMFKTNRSRTILTILGIGIGIAAILFLVSLGYGLQQLILNKITTSDALLSLDVTTGELDNLVLNDGSLHQIEQISGVDKVSPVAITQANMSVGDVSSELAINFVDNIFFQLDGTILSSGDFFQDKDIDKIIISSNVLKLFNIKKEEAFNSIVNFSVYIQENDEENKNERDSVDLQRDFKIVGIIEDDASSFVYMPFLNSDVLKSKNYNKIKVKIVDENSLDAIRGEIMDLGLTVSALSDVIEQANQVFKVLQIVLASFGIVALVVSAIGMFNTMTISLLERTQEIGIMKALGATSEDIWSLFLSESVIIGFLGGSGGIIIGIGGGNIFNYIINFLAGAFGGEGIDLFFTPIWFIMLIIIFSTLVGLITGFYPAKRAASINCLEALRYK